jgi:hypothetical protein
MRNVFAIATILCLGLFSPVWAQLGNGVLTGTVSDTSDARIPGVTVRATNTQTGLETVVLSNETGTYNIPNLVPGVYSLRGSLPGFQTQTFQNVNLGGNQTLRLNFTLQVAGTQTQVEVSVDAQDLLTLAGGAVGEVLINVQELPTVGNDALDLVNALPGVQLAPGGTLVFGDSNQAAGASRWTTIAGVSATFTNTSVNGVNVTDNFYSGIGEPDNTSGILSVTRINPEMIGELRLVTTPVDAEMGRGNAQIHLTTRSGTDRFTGMARWDSRNPALNARSWIDHSTVPLPPEPWYNQNQFTVSYGGPIVKSKTFFFALYDQQIDRRRTPVNNTVLSPCARNGIFRYFPGWVNGNAFTPTPAPTSAQNQSRAVVDFNGNAVRPTTNPDGTPYTDSLRYVSVFGPINFANFPATVAPDCSNIPLVNGNLAGASGPATAWDTNRWNSDRTGFISKLLGETPLPNNYEIGDGLNTAGNRYVRRQEGADGGGFFGAPATTSDNTNRKQINVKIDHLFTASHKLGTQLSYERDDSDGFPPLFQTGFWGTVERRPLIFSANLNSTLSSSMVNEVRFGVRRTSNFVLEAMDNPEYSDKARSFFPSINGIPTITTVPILGSPMLGFADNSQGNKTRALSFSDTLSWTRGQHSFRFGGDFRTTRANVFNNPNLIPRATGSAGAVPVLIANNGNSTFEGLLDNNTNYGNGNGAHFQAGNLVNLENLLLLQSGSLGLLQQYYFASSVQDIDKFASYSSARNRYRTWRQNEVAFFFQDDWKLSRNLTMNLGLRWEYYGPPWEANGLLPVGKGSNLASAFGISGDNWDDWWQANPRTNGSITVIELAGPNSPNPSRSLYLKDKNNFGPVFGFSYNVPWFGEGKTVVRGGFSVTYQGGGNFAAIDGTASGDVPGAALQAVFPGLSSTYLRLADFGTNHASLTTPGTFNFRDYPSPAVVPLTVDPANPARAIRPLTPTPLRFRPLGGIPSEFYDDVYVSPYIQNFTLGITRSVGPRMTLDVRYIGTVARKLFSEQPVNSANFLTNGLKEAFDAARAGGESALLNDLTSSVNGAFGGSGAAWLRNQTGGCPGFTPIIMADSLARGDYNSLAECLAFTNGTAAAGGVLVGQPQEAGLVLKRSVNARFPNGVPDNFIIANPQFGYLNIVSNTNKTNYHSLQTQFTMRPKSGVSYQGTFTWSRLLGSPTSPNTFGQGTGYVAYYAMDRRNEDYGVQFQHRRLDFRSHATVELPFGPNRALLTNSSGWLARLVENWQVSAIFNTTTGIPMTIVGRSALYESRSSSNFAAFAPETTVAPVDITPEGFARFGNFTGIGKVDWQAGAASGTYFPGVTFTRVPDPQCAAVSTVAAAGLTLRERCNNGLSAVAVDGTVVLKNAMPGTRGNLGANTMEGPGRWTLDSSISKGFRLDETRKLELRADATNVLNHPIPCSPAFCNVGVGQTNRGTNLQLNGLTPFGLLGVKNAVGSRQFQVTVRLEF